MKPEDFAGATPELDLEDYFAGKTRAWGIFEDRFGTLRRQFTVDITGTVEGDTLTLVEDFVYADGEIDQRIWTITRTGPHTVEGRADDVIGVAKGTIYGNALNWVYTLNLKVGSGTWAVRFDDWMYLQPGGVMINRARVSKWGIDLGEVTLSFFKEQGQDHTDGKQSQ